MVKTNDLKNVVVNGISYNYFFKGEKCDSFGNPRFRVFIIDPDGPAVYETILKTYCLKDSVKNYIENFLEGDLNK